LSLEECHVEDCSAGSTALAIAAGTFAYAQQGQDGRDFAPRWRPSAEDISALSDARIAALHAGLKLNAEQEKIWPPVEAALRDLAKQRADWFAARASADRPTDLIERLKLRADTMTRRGAALKKLADAASPLSRASMTGRGIAWSCSFGLPALVSTASGVRMATAAG
jgi:zinc resistance-associated protein